MALVNGKILKGDRCPYKDECHMMVAACSGDECPFLYKDEYFCDFSCGSERFFKIKHMMRDLKLETAYAMVHQGQKQTEGEIEMLLRKIEKVEDGQ